MPSSVRQNKRILISGFEPFSTFAANPTMELAGQLAKARLPGIVVKSLILPVTFKESFLKLRESIDDWKPDLVLSLGLAANRRDVQIETRAQNIIAARIADNDGLRPRPRKIHARQPEYLRSRLPISHMMRAARAADLPVRRSRSAGTYVCNYLMYNLLLLAEERGIAAGFIHVPYGKRVEHDRTGRKVPVSKILRALVRSLGEDS